MANGFNLPSNLFLFIITSSVLYVAYRVPKLIHQKETNLVFYVHDYFTGDDSSVITVAGETGPTSDILKFGTLVVVDDPVTEGPNRTSREIGRAQGIYCNSQLDGKALYLAFSVIFSDGEYAGSTLEIQGADKFSMPQREFGIVSGTGYFRFVKGFGVLETHFLDVANLKAILKLTVRVKHY